MIKEAMSKSKVGFIKPREETGASRVSTYLETCGSVNVSVFLCWSYHWSKFERYAYHMHGLKDAYLKRL